MFTLPKASTSALDFPMGEERDNSPEKQSAEIGGRQRVNGERNCLATQKRFPMLMPPFKKPCSGPTNQPQTLPTSRN
jgi:hypothetical protein